MNKQHEIEELQRIFSDVLNYDADDPFSPINPISYKTPEGDTCLHIAALRGNSRAIELLLDLGLDINAIGDMGNTPLHFAAMGKHIDAFDLLVRKGANTIIENEFGIPSGEQISP